MNCACWTWARTDGRISDHHPNCEKFAHRRFVRITLAGHGTYVQPEGDLRPLLDEIEEATPGAKWTLELVEMTPEEYDRLPEFAGH